MLLRGEAVKTVRDLELAVIEAAKEDHRGGCAPEACGGSSLDPCRLANALDALALGCGEHDKPEPAPEWIASTFLHIEKGDRLRIGQDEATVLSVFKSTWHADTSDSYRPKPWEHVELYADLGFGRSPFPTDTPVEILCDEQRKAKLALSHAGLKPEEL